MSKEFLNNRKGQEIEDIRGSHNGSAIRGLPVFSWHLKCFFNYWATWLWCRWDILVDHCKSSRLMETIEVKRLLPLQEHCLLARHFLRIAWIYSSNSHCVSLRWAASCAHFQMGPRKVPQRLLWGQHLNARKSSWQPMLITPCSCVTFSVVLRIMIQIRKPLSSGKEQSHNLCLNISHSAASLLKGHLWSPLTNRIIA